jgi:hypothetical protein
LFTRFPLSHSHSLTLSSLSLSLTLTLTHSQLVNKEKETREGSSDEESEKEEIEEVDREITEKEEILLKLKEAVKGFGAMKHEYETLLSSIHTLELERNELEIALEKVKKDSTTSKQQHSTATPTVNSERLQERYLRVKEELEKMKTDKNKKESTYRLIQSETKKCEILTKEILKLKEMKIKLQQTQRLQHQQHLKFKKEQSAKMCVLKRSDLKRQKQMNDLKSELQKKVRVLGNKDREILRIVSKLKAAEEHINQLIRLNNSRRQKLITTGTTKASSSDDLLLPQSVNGLGNILPNGGSGSTNTSSCDHQFLQSSRGILENLIQEKIDMKHNKKVLNKKVVLMRELKEEMNELLVTIRELEKRRTDLEGSSAYLEETSQTENEELLQILSELKSYEMNLSELTTEVTVLNEDIADLSRQLGDTIFASTASATSGSGSSSSSSHEPSAWEGISRGVIASLSLAQSQALLWDYLQNKAELMDSLREGKDYTEELLETVDKTNKKNYLLQNEIEVLRLEMKHLSSAAEKQRVNDIWTLFKTQADSASSSSAASSSGGASAATATAATARLDSIAIQRAQELEGVLSESLVIENELKAEIYELQYQNKELLKKLQHKIKLEHISRANRKEGRGRVRSEDVRDGEGDGEEEENSLQKKLREELSGRYGELNTLWVKLGTSVSEREKALDLIDNASQLALDKILTEARDHHSLCLQEKNFLQKKFDHYVKLMQLPSSPPSPSPEISEGVGEEEEDEGMGKRNTLITKTHSLKQKLIPLEEEFEKRSDKVKKIAVKLRKVTEEMEYDSATLPVELQILLKLDLQYLATTTTTSASSALALTPDQRAAYCLSHNIPFTSSALSFMESKLMELSLECTQNISRITELIQSLTPLRHRLGLKTFEDLMQLLAPTLEEADEDSLRNSKGGERGGGVTERKRRAEVGINLILNHKVKITGSGRVLESLENILFVLLSWKTNRETCSQSLEEFVKSVRQDLHLDLIPTPPSSTGAGGSGGEMMENGAVDVISRNYLLETLDHLKHFPVLMDRYLDSSQLELYALAGELGISSEEYEPRMNLIANTPPQTAEELRIYSEITQPMKALEGIVPFLEEVWLRSGIEDLLVLWNERSNDANFVSLTSSSLSVFLDPHFLILVPRPSPC